MEPEVRIVPRGSRRKTWCKHYRGTANGKTCAAGVEYASVQVEHEPVKYRHDAKEKGEPYTATRSLPCIQEWNFVGATCEKCEFRTPEEVAAEEKESEERFARIGLIRLAIVEACGGPWKRGMPGSGGKIECPACKTGTVSYSRAGYNGHIHAACSTPNCARWME